MGTSMRRTFHVFHSHVAISGGTSLRHSVLAQPEGLSATGLVSRVGAGAKSASRATRWRCHLSMTVSARNFLPSIDGHEQNPWPRQSGWLPEAPLMSRHRLPGINPAELFTGS